MTHLLLTLLSTSLAVCALWYTERVRSRFETRLAMAAGLANARALAGDFRETAAMADALRASLAEGHLSLVRARLVTRR